jgi:hypothetical protein
MTQNQIVVRLNRFRRQIRKLAQQCSDDRDFWSEYAHRANAIEARCPVELRDYAKGAILTTIREVTKLRSAGG